jgi:hypothetical protein
MTKQEFIEKWKNVVQSETALRSDVMELIYDAIAEAESKKWEKFSEELPQTGQLIIHEFPPESKRFPQIEIFHPLNEWYDGEIWMSYNSTYKPE